MTANQIAYNNLVEAQRHNRVAEEISRDSTRVAAHQAETSRLRYGEEARHNAVEEDIKRGTLAISSSQVSELSRHNRASEDLQKSEIAVRQSQVAESQRHNVASETLAQAQLSESKRHALATESLSRRQANLQYQVGMANASAAAVSANAAMVNARVNQQNVGINSLRQLTEQGKAAEIVRHNKEMERIQNTSAKAALTQADAASRQAAVKEDLAQSTKVSNYTNAAASAIKASEPVLAVIGKLLS